MNNEVGYHIKTDYYYEEMHIPNNIQNDNLILAKLKCNYFKVTVEM